MRWCGLYALLLACTVGAQPQSTVQPIGDFAQTEGVRGQLIPQQKTTLAAGMGGKLSRVTATIGQRVKRGQRLVVFDCGVLQARQSIAQASVRASQARFESNQALLSLNSVGPLEVNLSAAELAMAKGELQVIERELDQCEIVAPFSGVVVERFVEPHQYVPTGEALLSLVSNNSLEVRLLAPSVWSGTQRNSLSGRHVRFASLVYTYRMLENDFGAIRLPLYLGASLETGNAWADKKDVDFGDLVEASSVFLGWDSPLGPAYLAYGRSSGGDDSFYAYLGIVF